MLDRGHHRQDAGAQKLASIAGFPRQLGGDRRSGFAREARKGLPIGRLTSPRFGKHEVNTERELEDLRSGGAEPEKATRMAL